MEGAESAVQGCICTGYLLGYHRLDPHGQVRFHVPPRLKTDDSLHNYRNFLKDYGLDERIPGSTEIGAEGKRLSIMGHTVAGLMAGWTK